MRKFLSRCFLVATACIALASSASAVDARSFQLGDLEVIALQDVATEGNPGLLIGLGQADAEKYLTPGALKNSINAFVVRNDEMTLLFDTGLGTGGARKGDLLESLARAGIQPGDVDAVLITHFHGDHVGGLLKDGEPVFPKARLLVPRVELEARKGAGIEFYTA